MPFSETESPREFRRFIWKPGTVLFTAGLCRLFDRSVSLKFWPCCPWVWHGVRTESRHVRQTVVFGVSLILAWRALCSHHELYSASWSRWRPAAINRWDGASSLWGWSLGFCLHCGPHKEKRVGSVFNAEEKRRFAASRDPEIIVCGWYLQRVSRGASCRTEDNPSPEATCADAQEWSGIEKAVFSGFYGCTEWRGSSNARRPSRSWL